MRFLKWIRWNVFIWRCSGCGDHVYLWHLGRRWHCDNAIARKEAYGRGGALYRWEVQS